MPLIMGIRGYTTGGGGQVKFHPYERGGGGEAEKVCSHVEGGRKRFPKSITSRRGGGGL